MTLRRADTAARLTGRTLSDESLAQLVDRGRRSLVAFCFFLAAFAVGDVLYSREHVPFLFALKALQLVVVAGTLRILRSPRGVRHAVPVLVVAALAIFANIAVGAVGIGDVLVTPMTVMGIALLVGAAYPWGLVPQCIVAAGGAAAVAWNAVAARGLWAVAAYPQLSTYVGLFMSAWVARVFERHRRAAEEADLFGALARLGTEMVSSLAAPELLRRLCELTATVLRCGVSRTFLRGEGGSFVAVATHVAAGDSHAASASETLPGTLPEPIGSRLDRAEVLVIGRDAAGDAGGLRALWDGGTIRWLLILPLREGADLIGLHTAGRVRDEPFSARDQRVARGMARIASMALQNALLFERVEEANRLKSDFVATMSHELRTPLHVIIGYTQILREQGIGPLNAEQADTAARIEENARRLLELIEATLDVSRLDAGRVAVRVEQVRLRELAERVRDEVRPGPGVEVQWQVAGDLPVLRTDPVKLRVILKNLVSNAVKFTPCGTVAVSANLARNGVEITVRDTGIGIAKEAQAVVFEPFRQADCGPARERGGVGLGLYIVRRLVELLGGEISLESEPGQGSTFRVWIPCQPPASH